MKSLLQSIKESIENDNMIYLLDKWFNTHPDEKVEFMNLLVQYQNKSFTQEQLKSYIDNTDKLKETYKSFVTFMIDDIEILQNKDIDYIYLYKNIICQLIGYKSKRNKYIIAP